MEKLQWFKFSPTDWKMGKIQRLPAETQIRFISLLCLYWNKDCVMSYDDAEVEIDKEHLDLLVSKRVIKVDDGSVVIEFLNEQFVEVSSTINNKSTSGKVGNLKRWHPAIYKQYISGKINLEQALNIAHPSHTDSEPIADQSQNIAEEKREEDIRKELDKKLLTEIDISDVELGLVDHFKIAKEFQRLFIENLTERNISTSHQQKATFKNYVDPIRLMIQNNEATRQDLIDVWKYLKSKDGEFWKTNIQSTSKLRDKFTTLLMNARKPKIKDKTEGGKL